MGGAQGEKRATLLPANIYTWYILYVRVQQQWMDWKQEGREKTNRAKTNGFRLRSTGAEKKTRFYVLVRVSVTYEYVSCEFDRWNG